MAKCEPIPGRVLLCVVLSGMTYADTAPPADALSLARQDYENALHRLDTEVQRCQALKRQAGELKHDIEALGQKVPKAALLTGVGFLAARNIRLCEAGAKGELALAWLNYLSIAKEQGIRPGEVVSDQISTLLSPSAVWYAMQARYAGLPAHQRSMMEEAIGQAPFDGPALLNWIEERD